MRAYYNGEPLSFGSSGGGSGGGVPIGTIVIWSGSAENVPAGWHICDGTNGTPDLRDKFVLGAGESHPVDETGGEEEVTLTTNQMPKHTHNINSNSLYTRYTTSLSSNGEVLLAKGERSGALSSAGSAILNAGGSEPFNNMPPYYALCYIQKIAPDETDGGEVYSEEETVIGTWLGKPLYQKVFAGTTEKGDSTDTGNTNVTDSLIYNNVDKIISQTGYVLLSTGTTVSLPWHITPTDQMYIITKKDGDLYLRAANHFHGCNYSILAEYTKTTD